MWPYGGKRTHMLNNGKNLKLMGNNYYPHGAQSGSPNKEYFNQLSMSVSVGLNSYPANSIAPDGRIVRQYGISKHDVTDEFYGRNHTGFKNVNLDKTGKQFHNRNVSQLKVVLNMPARQRRDSLSQITTSIVKNEVAPPLSQLQHDEILREHLRKSAANLQSVATKLPPLRKAKRLEQMALSNMRQDSDRRLSVKLDENSDVEDEDGFPYIGMRLPRRKSSDHFDVSNIQSQRPAVNWKNGIMRRRKSFGLRFGVKDFENDNENSSKNYENRFSKGLERKDSVGKITESIRDQFRAVLQDQLMSQERNTKSRDSGIADSGLALTRSVGNESLIKQIPKERSKLVKSGYKLRHEYGRNLEKNWFRNEYLKKQTKEKKLNRSPGESGYNLRLDIFYSPEPQSDEDSGEEGANIFLEEDDASMQCGGFSTATAEERSRRQRVSMQSLRKSLSLDTHREGDEDTGDTSESDIEIILKDNQLIQRKTKHKMLKKRKRQIERYKPFLLTDIETVREQKETDECPPLTDQEIRALRLNLKNKEKMKKLTGKRKFLQISNAVFAFIQFRNILRSIRRRKKNIIRKRQQRIAKMVAKRWTKKIQDNSEESDRESTSKPTLKEQFLQEIGHKLIFDIEKLNIQQTDSSDEEEKKDVESDSNNEEDNERKKELQSKVTKPDPDKVSKFAAELKKISVKDLKSVKEITKTTRKRQRKRRHSIPKIGRPFEFLIEIPVKTRQRRSRSRASVPKQSEMRRAYSPPAPKCSCHRGKQTETTLRSQPPTKDNKCPHQPEVKSRKVKTVKVNTAGLMRTHSLENLSRKRPIELKDLLADIDIPAKEIKLQILARKFRRQRKKKQQIRLSPCRLPERPVLQQEDTDADSDISGGSENSDESDYDFVYGGPFVGSGVMWNKNSKEAMRPTWTEEDVDRELKRITMIFHEMKECKYLRLDGFNDAIMEKLKQTSNNF